MPVGTSNSTIPAVKNALAANASRLERPASSRKIVLIPQMNDAASVLPSVRSRYTRWTERAVGIAMHIGTAGGGGIHRPGSVTTHTDSGCLVSCRPAGPPTGDQDARHALAVCPH